jgi:hypothetical protein
MRPGVVFVPFHYGYWDPASKQPLFKTAAAAVRWSRGATGARRRRARGGRAAGRRGPPGRTRRRTVKKGIELTLRALHHGEASLVRRLTAVAERHRAEHEVHHAALDLAGWSREHVRRPVEATGRGGRSTQEAGSRDGGLLTMLRTKAGEAVAHRPEPGLLLLRDLRDLHLAATENSLHWEMLAQAARAARDEDLLALASACHPRTLRQTRWTNTMIKNLAPQLLTALQRLCPRPVLPPAPAQYRGGGVTTSRC